jgi:HTH-type transcriptional regulator, fmd operon transcriptional regulator
VFSKSIKQARSAMRKKESATFLTDRQVEILKMKKKGMTQADIAKIERTTRGNICIIEKTALRNVERANNTINLYKTLEAPVWLTIPVGTDLLDVPKMVFKAADKKRVKISIDSAMIIVKLKTQVPYKMHGRLITNEIDISADQHGNLTIT